MADQATLKIQLVPLNAQCTLYHGLISSVSMEGQLILDVGINPTTNRMQGVRCISCNGLDQKTSERLDAARSALALCESMDAVDTELRAALAIESAPTSMMGVASVNSVSAINSQFYAALLSELSNVNWSYIHKLVYSPCQVTLCAKDSANHAHYLTVQLPEAFPDLPPYIVDNNPLSRAITMVQSIPGCWLSNLVGQMQKKIDEYAIVWQQLHDADEQLWTLDSADELFSRRIIIGNLVSLDITLNEAGTLPEWRFFGAETSVAPLRSQFYHHLSQWDTRASIKQNLEQLLQITLPARSDTTDGQASGHECGICYAYWLESSDTTNHSTSTKTNRHIPDVTCRHPDCSRPFHRACLVEWLRADTNAHQTLGVVFGSCPYCAQSISTNTLVQPITKH
ncbi:WD-repeat region-domain-containing protein [Syncephalis fuscata]|nr:WD-repeat region-domain-containing protein [Syncephalis fuscata]